MAKKSRLGDRHKTYTPPPKNNLVLQDLQKDVETLDIEYVAPKTLKAHPKNQEYYEGFSGDEYETLKADIKQAGKVLKAIEVSSFSGFVIAGCRRLQIAIELDLPHIPIIYRKFNSDEDELDYLIKDNILQRHLTQKDYIRIIEQRFGDRVTESRRGGDRHSQDFKNQQTERLDQEISRRLGIPESTVRKCLAAIRKRKTGQEETIQEPTKLETFKKKLSGFQTTFEKFDFSENERDHAIKLLQQMISSLKNFD